MSEQQATVARRPSCPCCGENRAVETIERRAVGIPEHRAGRYLCALCWTVFDGNDEEWRRWSRRRETRAKSYEYQRAKWAAQRAAKGGSAA